MKTTVTIILAIVLNVGAYFINGWLGGVMTFVFIFFGVIALLISANSAIEQDLIMLKDAIINYTGTIAELQRIEKMIIEIDAEGLDTKNYARYKSCIELWKEKLKEE